MINSYLKTQISEKFPYPPTEDQVLALTIITEFLLAKEQNSLLLLKGYAGTGKTSLVGSLVKTLNGIGQKTVLMAPTGRASKVFSGYAGQQACTIHKKIYRQKTYSGEFTDFIPADNLYKDTLFIVDEASMISNNGIDSHQFGSGRLLDDLIKYVYAGENCRLILMGDTAQLPPVGQTDSPALRKELLEGYLLTVYQIILTQTVRQGNGSGILYNATRLREALRNKTVEIFPKLVANKFPDVKKIAGDELLDEIEASYSRDGIDGTIFITRSNKRAGLYNKGIRERILYREDELASGDRLMVTKNNYYWTANKEEGKNNDFIANGEMVEVLRVRKTTELYGFHFADLSVRLKDQEIETDVKILLETLHSDTSALSREENEKLFLAILDDYDDIPGKAAKMRKMKVDPYFNAVQVKYAYAITCHKAQGGQWNSVFLDIGYMTDDMLGEDFYRWLYTAVTRSIDHLYLVNLPKELEENPQT